MILQGIDASARQHASLAHATAYYFAPASGFIDKIFGANEYRAHRSTKSFG